MRYVGRYVPIYCHNTFSQKKKILKIDFVDVYIPSIDFAGNLFDFTSIVVLINGDQTLSQFIQFFDMWPVLMHFSVETLVKGENIEILLKMHSLVHIGECGTFLSK